MSYILDALKKLEHEKARKSRSGGVVNITGELFENEPPRPAGKATWKIAGAVVIAVLATFVLTWTFLPSAKHPPVAVSRSLPPVSASAPVIQPQPKVEPVATPAVPYVPAPQPQVARSAQPVRPHPSTTSSLSTSQRSVPVTQAAKQPVTASVAAPAKEDAAALLTQQELLRRLKDRKPVANPVLPGMTPPADIKLSGIAYQDERRARRAVVNGFLVQEGATVAGSVVTDIFQDRVRFSQGGRSFELSLISAGTAGVGRVP